MKKKLLVVTIASALGLAGCGFEENSDNQQSQQPQQANFSGTVNKGIVSNGKVEVCDTFNETGCIDGQGWSVQTTTNTDGQYGISGAPLNKPLLVMVSKKDPSTTMKCDIATCFASDGTTVLATFGTKFTVLDGWKLKTILAAANTATETVNVTSLTNIAAEQALEDAGSEGVTTAIANNANEIVEEIFGLEGAITELGAVDLTDPIQIAQAAPEELNAALYSAAIMSADIDTDALIVNNGTEYTILPSLLEIITSAEALVSGDTPLVEVPTEAKKEFDDHKADLTTGKDAFVDGDGDGKLDSIVKVPTPTASNEVLAAKAFIKDVRTVYLTVQDSGDLKSGLTDFGSELDRIAPLMQADAERVLNNTQFAIEAVVNAFDAHDPQDPKTFIDESGFTVTVNGTTFTAVLVTSDSESTEVIANIKHVALEKNETSPCENSGVATDPVSTLCADTIVEDGTASANIDLEILSIAATANKVSLTGAATAKVDALIGNWHYQESGNDQGYDQSYDNGNDTTKDGIASSSNGDYQRSWSDESNLTVNGITATLSNIKMSFSETSSIESAQYIGDISLQVAGLAVSNKKSSSSDYRFESGCDENGNNCYFNDQSNYSDTGEHRGTFTYANVTFKGELAASGDAFAVYLNIVADNKRGYVSEGNYSYSSICSWAVNAGCSDYSNHTQLKETQDKYVEVYVTAEVATKVHDTQNNNVVASVKLEANRSEFDTVKAKVTVDYNDVDTIIETEVGIFDNHIDPALVVRNTTGTVATFHHAKYGASADITVNGIKAASIEETDNNLVLVRYSDGSFESLF